MLNVILKGVSDKDNSNNLISPSDTFYVSLKLYNVVFLFVFK